MALTKLKQRIYQLKKLICVTATLTKYKVNELSYDYFLSKKLRFEVWLRANISLRFLVVKDTDISLYVDEKMAEPSVGDTSVLSEQPTSDISIGGLPNGQ